QTPGFDGAALAKALVTLKWRAALRMQADYRRNRRLAYGITMRLRRAQRRKQVSAIVHNRRDLCDTKYLYGIREVFDHPLAFLGSAEAEAVRARASRQCVPMLVPLPADAVLIGVFGFLNEYNVFNTSILALHHLSETQN